MQNKFKAILIVGIFVLSIFGSIASIPLSNGQAIGNDGNAYITFASIGQVSELGLTNNTLWNNINVGSGAYAIALSSTNAYISNSSGNELWIMGLANNTVWDTIYIGNDSMSIALNLNNVYTANFGSDNVSVIGLTNNTVWDTVYIGTNPQAIALSSSNAYVTDYYTGNVSVIGLANNTLWYNITGLDYPRAIAVSSTNIYITNQNNTVAVAGLSNNTIWNWISGFDMPYGIALSSTDAFITNINAGTVSVVGLSNNTLWDTITVGGAPNFITTSSNNAYLNYNGADGISVIGLTNYTLWQNISTSAVPNQIAINYLYIPPQNVSISMNGNVSDTSLGSIGTTWYVDFNGTIYSALIGQDINFTQNIGTYPYSAWINDNGYNVIYGNYTVQEVAINYLNLTFTFTGYTISVNESGLPSGYTWTTDITGYISNNSTQSEAGFTSVSSNVLITPDGNYISNGTYLLQFTANNYVATPSSEYVTVNGSDVYLNIVFNTSLIVNMTGNVGDYGSIWYFDFNGTVYNNTVGNNITVPIENGTYPYSAWINNNGYNVIYGNYTTSNTANNYLNLTFTYTGYFITVEEEGLPSGQQWSFSIYGEIFTNTTNNITGFQTTSPSITIPDDSYGFSNFSDYQIVNVYASAYNGTVVENPFAINGSNITVVIQFTPIPANLTIYSLFLGEGISNYSWSIYIPLTNTSINEAFNEGITIGNLPQNQSFDIYIEYPYQTHNFPSNFISSVSMNVLNSSDLFNVTINWINYHPYGNSSNTNTTYMYDFPYLSYIHLSITITSENASINLPINNTAQNISLTYANNTNLPLVMMINESGVLISPTLIESNGYITYYYVNPNTDGTIGILVQWELNSTLDAYLPTTSFIAQYEFNNTNYISNNTIILIQTFPNGNAYDTIPNTIYWINVSAQNINLNVSFSTSNSYTNITLIATGLPSGTPFIFVGISLNFTFSYIVSTSVYQLIALNGQYTYNATTDGYESITGTFIASGNNITITLNFIPITNTTHIYVKPYVYNEYVVIGALIVIIIIMAIVLLITKNTPSSLLIGSIAVFGAYEFNVFPQWVIYIVVMMALAGIGFWLFLKGNNGSDD